jgi:hypothetical protein
VITMMGEVELGLGLDSVKGSSKNLFPVALERGRGLCHPRENAQILRFARDDRWFKKQMVPN